MDWTVSLKKTYVPYIPSISQKNQLKRTQTLQEQPSQRMPKALFPFLQHFFVEEAKARHLDENDGDTSGLESLERSVLSRLEDNH